MYFLFLNAYFQQSIVELVTKEWASRPHPRSAIIVAEVKYLDRETDDPFYTHAQIMESVFFLDHVEELG